MSRLTLVVPVALFLIVALLYASFRSSWQTALVLTNVPFALVGGVAMLWLRGFEPQPLGERRLHRAVRHRGAERRGC